MSNFRYENQCCHREREYCHNVKHSANGKSPHHNAARVTDHHPNRVNVTSNGSLKQHACCSYSTSGSVAAGDNTNTHKQTIRHHPSKEGSCRIKESNPSKHRHHAAKSTTSSTSTNTTADMDHHQPHDGNHHHHRNSHHHRRNNNNNNNNNNSKIINKSELCYPVDRRAPTTAQCRDHFVWQEAKYVKDECGSGVVPLRLQATDPRRVWCRTPLTMYQSTIGELARRMLCNEVSVPKRVNQGPPCNLCEHVMPMCKGYYRKYECRRPCEEEHARMRDGKKVYRDAIQQYWMPCLSADEKRHYDLSKDAGHNVYLGKKLKRTTADKVVCW